MDSVGGGSGARPGSAGVSSLGQLLRQKYWQQDARVMQSADTQDSNVLGGALDRHVAEDDDGAGSSNTLAEADLPPSYTSKSATLPLDSRAADEEMMTGLEDDDYEDDREWQHPDHDVPVRSIEFAEDSEDDVPDFQDSPVAHSDMAASGSSQLAPVTETAIDDDYELIHVQPSASRHHHHHHHPPTDAGDLDPRAQSPAMDDGPWTFVPWLKLRVY